MFPNFRVHYKTGCTRLAAACDKVYQLLAHGRWFSPGTMASSTTKTGRHDIAEIFLKVALKDQQSINQSIVMLLSVCPSFCQTFCNIFVNTVEATSFIPQVDLNFSPLTVMLCVAFVIVLSVYYQMFIALQVTVHT